MLATAFILWVRHKLYDLGFLESRSWDVPVICVGNITVGGTGKTPFVEMLLRRYGASKRIAVVSRGYKRHSKGLVEVSVDSLHTEVGDEPLQIKRRFPDVTVVVDSKRSRAIDMLLARSGDERPEWIILDDGFQHRAVKPSTGIVLVDSHRPIDKDRLLPFGRLRDLRSRVLKADAVVVTKMDGWVDDNLASEWRQRLKLPHQMPLLFSKITYQVPVPVFRDEADHRYVYSSRAMVFCGLASPVALVNYVSEKYEVLQSFDFPDHHNYTASDFRKVAKAIKRNPMALLLTTEKDAQRIFREPELVPEEIRKRLFYLPIEAVMVPVLPLTTDLVDEEIEAEGYARLDSVINR
mgnify:CR=1 FL=1